MIAQLSQTAMGFVDTLMAAQVSAEDLAAVALGSSIWLPLLLSLGGILMATTPLVAQLVGGSQEQRTPAIFQHGNLVALSITLIAIALLRNCSPVLELMAISGTLLIKTQQYLDALSWGVPAILLYQVCRSYCEGFGKTRPIMKISVIALLCNIPLNYIFIYGKLGLPAYGGVGCGWASAIVMWIMAVAAVLYLHNAPQFKHYRLFSDWPRPSAKALLNFLTLGLPIGFTLLIEVSMFSVIALLIARFGDTVIAAHQITLSFTGLIFMIPLSISLALTIRVGQLVGRQQFAAARFAASTGILITCSCAVITCGLILWLAEQIAGLYTAQSDIVALASSLLMIAAIFQIPDALQVACAGALRGYKDASIPLLMVFTAYWLIGLPVGYTLGLTDLILPAQNAAGFWYSLVLGLSVGAILLASRLRIITRQCD